MRITELDLEKLGFQKVVITPEESGGIRFRKIRFSESCNNP